MRSVAIALLLSILGCSVPSYWVRPADLSSAPAPAERVSDHAAVRLRSGSYRPTDDPPRADGKIVVRGPGRHGKLWRAGLWVTVGGALAAFAGGMLTWASMSAFPQCDSTEGRHCPPPNPASAGLFIGGVTLSAIGDVSMLVVGPAMWIRGAQQRPVEVP